MTTALYARVSTAQQAREQAIASQLAALRQHAAAHGQAVAAAHHYLDDG
jgi:DNA invertase Pin-like site-specific DNA recombinase